MKNKKPSQADILRYGPDVAAIKASVSKKRWKKAVRIAHRQGHTIVGQLSGAPNALKERTNASLRKEAQRTVRAAYKPVMTELSVREKAANFLEAKRAADDAAYRQWMVGESEKLGAQASAADATLAAQEADIAADLNASQQAAHADSLARVAQQPGSVSDPSQSTALDQTAADTKSRERVANQRKLSADLTKVGGDAATVSRAALIATAAVREATRTAENWKTLAGISSDRKKAVQQQAADAAGMLAELRQGEVSKAQSNREFDLAAGELGAKQASLAAEIREANRKYGLDKKKFNLERWKAENSAAMEQARIDLGYDQIVAQDGRAAADRALRKWIEKRKAREKRKEADGRAGVDADERKLYQDVQTARGMIRRMQARGVPADKIRKRLLAQGVSDPMFELAQALWINNGSINPDIRAKARRLGIAHPGYFW